MTVAALPSKIDYLENGVTTSFAVPFRFLPGTITATRVLADGTVAALAAGVDFSTSGGGTDAGGTLALTGASISGARLRIRRATPRAQVASYNDNDRFPAESHEQALDRQTLINQEQDDRIADTANRALMVPDGETAPAVPSIASLLGKFLGVSASGKIVGLTGTGGGDAALRGDLAAETGADLVGIDGGGSLQDYLDANDIDISAINAALALVHQISTLAIDLNWLGGYASKVGFIIDAAADHPTMPQFGMLAQLTQDVEPTGTPGSVFKVAGAFRCVSSVDAPEHYGVNTVNDGKYGPGFGASYGIESDTNNRGAHADSVGGANPAYGFLAASAGSHRGTAAFAGAGYFDQPKWATMFAGWGYCKDATFHDSTNAASALDVRGAHSYGIDMALAASLGFAMRLPNNVSIAQLDAGGVLRDVIKVNASDELLLGDQGLAKIVFNKALEPIIDNILPFGTASKRLTTVYATTPSINTSDAREKSEPILLTDAELDAIGAVSIVLFQYLDAVALKGEAEARLHCGAIAQQVKASFDARGLDVTRMSFWCADPWMETIEEERQVEEQETETVSETIEEVVIEDGVPVLRRVVREIERPKFDQVPVLDEAGQPVMIAGTPSTIAPRLKAGAQKGSTEAADYEMIEIPGRPEAPRTHPVPVMRTVARMVPVERRRVDEVTGEPLVRLGLRYAPLSMAMHAWARRELDRQRDALESLAVRLAALEGGA